MSDQTVTATPAQRKVLRSLERRRDKIARLEASLKEEYAGRLEDFRTARSVMPPCLVRDICSSAGITEEAYRAVLRKANQSNGEG